MASDTILTDDYVAEMLAKEASEASIKYSSMGLEAFRSTKPANKAKPNTGFLGRIIKATTSHNAALLAKEAAEAQARLDNLTEAEERKRRKLRPSPSDMRRRQLGAISSILTGGKQKRKPDGDNSRATPGDRSSAPESEGKNRSLDRDRHRKSERKRYEDDGLKNKASRDRHHEEHDGENHRNNRHRDRSHSPENSSSARKYRQRSPLSDNEEDKYGRHRSSKSSRTGGQSGKGGDLLGDKLSARKREGRLARDDDKEEARSNHRSRKSRPLGREQNEREEAEFSSSSSDPLDDLIGPAPPSQSQSSSPVVKPRGRGAASGKSLMDSRFSAGYDPQSDDTAAGPATTAADPDWSEAVEVFRDRQKWKQQGAERLRTAGFTEEQIKKWESQKPNGEKDLGDVRWSKKGEKREWDRGKEGVLFDDGED